MEFFNRLLGPNSELVPSLLFAGLNSDNSSGREVFITGSTGYVGSRLIPLLVQRSHRVKALVRSGSEKKLPFGCTSVLGNALDKNSFQNQIQPSDTFVQLVGVAHPRPSKAQEFRKVDRVSVGESVTAAVSVGIQHFIYVSVAHPAPTMKDYIAVRREGEALIRESNLNSTILRPWYILGPGHRWPCLLSPMYWLCERLPSTRESARRLGLITLKQMLHALLEAVEHPVRGVKIIEVPEIRACALSKSAAV